MKINNEEKITEPFHDEHEGSKTIDIISSDISYISIYKTYKTKNIKPFEPLM